MNEGPSEVRRVDLDKSQPQDYLISRLQKVDLTLSHKDSEAGGI